MKVRDWRSLGINLLIVALIIYGVHLLNIVHGIDFVYLVYIVPGVIGLPDSYMGFSRQNMTAYLE